jgi:hypothetical protein
MQQSRGPAQFSVQRSTFPRQLIRRGSFGHGVVMSGRV